MTSWRERRRVDKWYQAHGWGKPPKFRRLRGFYWDHIYPRQWRWRNRKCKIKGGRWNGWYDIEPIDEKGERDD